jgi:xylitol oxidase
MEMVTASGEVITLSRKKDGDKFYGAVVNLGALGVVTKLTLNLQPAFNMKQDVYENLPLAELQYRLEGILSVGYSVSLFTDWKTDTINQVWIKRLCEEGDFTAAPLSPDFFGATPALKNLHPIPGMPEENCTAQMGLLGPWHERLPHFRMNFTPSSGAELQSEYFVPMPLAYKAIMAINQMRDHISSYLQISELRTIDGDNFWMSPCYQQPCLAIHFTWEQNWAAVSKILPKIEEKLAPFGVRPHWAKLFTMQPSRLKLLYKRLPEFQKLVSEYDPNGKFRNAFLERNILG